MGVSKAIFSKINMLFSTKKIEKWRSNCLKQPNYNFITETKGIYCTQHKKTDMVDVVHKHRCLEENCLKIPCFNFDSENKGI